MTEPRETGPRSSSWALGLLALGVLIVVVWMAWPRSGGPEQTLVEATEEVEEAGPVTPPGETVLPAAALVNSPDEWDGRLVNGEAMVAEVASEHAFWVSANGARVFVLLEPGSALVSGLEAGESVRLVDARVHAIDAETDLPESVPAATREAVEEETAYLTVDGADVLLSASM